jgi:hypothetical protein
MSTKYNQPTFRVARQRLLAGLEARGWRVARSLKVPHATSPDGATRLWFKTQAIYVNDPGTNPSAFSNTHSLVSDMRTLSGVADLLSRAGIRAGYAAGYTRTGAAKRGRTAAKNQPNRYIRIDRKAHARHAYYRKDGTHVKAASVPATRFTEVDPGRSGRRARGSKFGPYKKHPKWIQRPGTLGGKGYTRKPWPVRKALLQSSIEDFGLPSTLRRIRVLLKPIALYPETREVLEHDLGWLQSLGQSSGRKRRTPKRTRCSSCPR